MSNKKGKIIAESKIGQRKVIADMRVPIGDTDVNLICGKCLTMLVKGYSQAKFPDIVVRCINCGSLNEV